VQRSRKKFSTAYAVCEVYFPWVIPLRESRPPLPSHCVHLVYENHVLDLPAYVEKFGLRPSISLVICAFFWRCRLPALVSRPYYTFFLEKTDAFKRTTHAASSPNCRDIPCVGHISGAAEISSGSWASYHHREMFRAGASDSLHYSSSFSHLREKKNAKDCGGGGRLQCSERIRREESGCRSLVGLVLLSRCKRWSYLVGHRRSVPGCGRRTIL